MQAAVYDAFIKFYLVITETYKAGKIAAIGTNFHFPPVSAYWFYHPCALGDHHRILSYRKVAG
jgi:hypothetical protein